MRDLTLAAVIAASVLTLGCKSFRRDDMALSDYNRSREIESGVRGVDSDSQSDIQQVSYEEEDEDEGFSIDDLSPTNLTTTAKTMVGQGPNREVANKHKAEADALHAEAKRLIQDEETKAEAQKQFNKAGDLYLRAAARYPDSTIEHECLFQAGEAYFFADAYDASNDAYETLIEKYAGTRYLDRAEARRFSIARYWLDLNDFRPDNFFTYNFSNEERPSRDTGGNARRVLNDIRLDDPTGTLADDATMALGNAFFKTGRFLDAADNYADLRNAYPGSTHVFNASLLEIRARLEAYRGPAYDGTGLTKAENLLKSVVKQFPDKVDEQRGPLDELAAEIRFRLAERELLLAKLYDRRKEFRAARLHYQKIAVDYSDTSLAPEAQERLDEIAEEPDLPPQRMAWLVNLLPKPKDQKPLFNSDFPR